MSLENNSNNNILVYCEKSCTFWGHKFQGQKAEIMEQLKKNQQSLLFNERGLFNSEMQNRCINSHPINI